MARVLIAWELGEAWGHLARCLRLAQVLQERGHVVALVLKDIRFPFSWQLPPGIVVLTAPAIRQRRSVKMPSNYAEVLLCCGFNDVADVANRLRAWVSIFSLFEPDVLVADHAPTALLAAGTCGIPHLAVGNGFVIPPGKFPWPSIRQGKWVSDARLHAAEIMLDDVLVRAQLQLGGKVTVKSMRALFGPQDLLDTFAELDHYGCRAAGNYIGPIVSPPAGYKAKWQYPQLQHVLVYLRPEVGSFIAILQALSLLEAEVLCVIPGLSAGQAARLVTPHLRISVEPIDFTALLPVANAVVGYGNSGFSTQALLAGVPLLMCPRYVEQGMFASRVADLGAGICLDLHANKQQVFNSLNALLEQVSYKSAAGLFSRRYSAFTRDHAVTKSIEAIEHTVAGL